jgi:hypothetical protein
MNTPRLSAIAFALIAMRSAASSASADEQAIMAKLDAMQAQLDRIDHVAVQACVNGILGPMAHDKDPKLVPEAQEALIRCTSIAHGAP